MRKALVIAATQPISNIKDAGAVNYISRQQHLNLRLRPAQMKALKIILGLLALTSLSCDKKSNQKTRTVKIPELPIEKGNLTPQEKAAEGGDLNAARRLTTYWLAYRGKDVTRSERFEKAIKYYKITLKDPNISPEEKLRTEESIDNLESYLKLTEK